MLSKKDLSLQIKEYAKSLGFDACGFCRAEEAGEEKENLKAWLDKDYNSGMKYLEHNFEKRCDPTLLVEGAKSIISVALNYYPDRKQDVSHPQVAYYAYGKDYHDIVKDKLEKLYFFIQSLYPQLSGRYFCDSAPVLERYWAAKAGIGFIGKNTLLILPHKGSFFFLGELIINIELEYDYPLSCLCGKCMRCIEACPTKAFEKSYVMDSNKCISYQTIENKGDISEIIIPLLGNCLYGCDICQKVCPWNRFSFPHTIPELTPISQILSFSESEWDNLDKESFGKIFKDSALKRGKYTGLKRNLAALKRPDKKK